MANDLQLSSEQRLVARGGAAEQSAQAREVAEVQAAMVIAKRFPRDTKAALDRIQNSCTRVSLAEGALYSYSRGGTEISGPSIRLAEVMAQSWGNLDFGVRELSQDGGESVVQSYCWDLETNVRQTKTFTVPHARYTRNQGSKRLEDPRDIYEQVANQAARRLRSCILGVIPGDIQEAAVEQCELTLKADADTSEEGVKKILEAFERFGVTKEQIEHRIQRRLDSIRPAQVVSLRKIVVSLRDGMSGPEDWFEAPEASAKATAAAEKIAAAAGRKATEPAKNEPLEAFLEGSSVPPEANATAAAKTEEPPPPAPPPAEGDVQRIPDTMRRDLLKTVDGVGPKVLASLEEHGAVTARHILKLGTSGLAELPGIGKVTAANLIAWASKKIDETHRAEALAEKDEKAAETPAAPAPEEPPHFRDKSYALGLMKLAEEHGVTKEQLRARLDELAARVGLPAGVSPLALPDPQWVALQAWVQAATQESLPLAGAEAPPAEPPPTISEAKVRIIENMLTNLLAKMSAAEGEAWQADFAGWLKEKAGVETYETLPAEKYQALLSYVSETTDHLR